ncbi:MAG: DUF4384 domain-containing protein [Rhodocyclaceae bacterium]|nr:DUF4384 domain-containing protein [Rhodocyclaceae bacterium]
MRLGRTLTTLALAAATLGGCATVDTKGPVIQAAEEMKAGPQNKPYRTITGFTQALQCMDNTMIVYGVRDLSLLVEDLVDNTKKVDAGTKDMLVSAVSAMSRRSRSIRLVTFGADAGNLANFLFNAEQKGAYTEIPDYDIRGSISQFDDNLAKKQIDGALGISRIGIGAARSGSVSILGLDLTMISTQDFSVIPGVTANNQVIIFKEGDGVDGEAEFNKWGINFSLTLTRNEGKAQALRNLVELASIELVGKVSKTPYWKCLGATADNPAIQKEVSDWFYTMAGDGSLYTYMQQQLRMRGYYNGPVDGGDHPTFMRAIVQYREVLGLSAEARLDQEFLMAYLEADHVLLAAKYPPPKPIVSGYTSPLQIDVISASGMQRFNPGDRVDIEVLTNRDAHVYCYLQDETAQVQRFYPNRFKRDSLLQAGHALEVPGDMKFRFIANGKRVTETVACFATEQDVMGKLPPVVAGSDFSPIRGITLEHVRTAYAKAAGGNLAEGVFHVSFR